MAVLIPIIRCSLTWEQYNASNQIIKKDVYKLVDFGLSRNEFREIQFEVTLLGKEVKTRSISAKYESLNIFRKFVQEGKLTLDFKESLTKVWFLFLKSNINFFLSQLLISNAPPSDLVIFTKSLAAKLAGTKDQPKMSTRAKLRSDIASFTEGISPVTAKVRKLSLNLI